eukprot:5939438-Amphidinium_carterae.1
MIIFSLNVRFRTATAHLQILPLDKINALANILPKESCSDLWALEINKHAPHIVRIKREDQAHVT